MCAKTLPFDLVLDLGVVELGHKFTFPGGLDSQQQKVSSANQSQGWSILSRNSGPPRPRCGARATPAPRAAAAPARKRTQTYLRLIALPQHTIILPERDYARPGFPVIYVA
jgi:hypothetical protein